MTRIRIHPAKRKHIKIMNNINRECLPENYPYEFWIELISKHLSWIIEVNFKIIGYIAINTLEDMDGKIIPFEYLIVSIAILPAFRQLGYATKLITKVLTELKSILSVSTNLRARTDSIGIIKLQVRKNNLEAQALYKKLGFVKINEITDYYQNPIDDAIEMSKMIN